MIRVGVHDGNLSALVGYKIRRDALPHVPLFRGHAEACPSGKMDGGPVTGSLSRNGMTVETTMTFLGVRRRGGESVRGRCDIAVARKAQEERHGGDRDVQPDVGVVVFDHSHEWLVAVNESKQRHEQVDDAEDLEVFARRTRTGEPAEERRKARSEVDHVVHRSDHEDAEEHSVWSECREKAANAGDNEEDTENDCSGFEHRMFFVGWP